MAHRIVGSESPPTQNSPSETASRPRSTELCCRSVQGGGPTPAPSGGGAGGLQQKCARGRRDTALGRCSGGEPAKHPPTGADVGSPPQVQAWISTTDVFRTQKSIKPIWPKPGPGQKAFKRGKSKLLLLEQTPALDVKDAPFQCM